MDNTESLTPAPDFVRTVLKARAKELAKPLEIGGAEEVIHTVVFTISGENYAIESEFITETLLLTNLTSLPFTPPFIAGVTNVRGKIFSVVSTTNLLGLPKQEISVKSRVIILKSGSMSFGLVADTLIGYQPIYLKDIQPAPQRIRQDTLRYLKGITREGLIMLDAKKILDDDSLIVGR